MTIARTIPRALGAFTLAIASLLGTAYAEGKPAITEVLKVPLATGAGQEVIVSEVNYPPGFSSPSHYHTGHVIVYILDGKGAMEVDGQARTGEAGDVIQELPEKVMVMRNESDSEWLRFVVFQVGPQGEPMIVKTD